MASEDWQRLASYVVSGRVTLGITDRKQFVTASGVSYRTLSTLESGKRVSPEVLAKVSAVLGWSPDSPRRVLRGAEPVRSGDPAPPPQTESEKLAAWAAAQITGAGRSIREADQFLRAEGLPGREPAALPVDFYRRLADLTGLPLSEVMVGAGVVSPGELAHPWRRDPEAEPGKRRA